MTPRRPLISLTLTVVVSLAVGCVHAAVCTEVIGYSQTLEWYQTGGAFESVVEDGRWQLLGRNGAATNLWADPDFDGWTLPLFSPCTTGSEAPDRVVLTISGTYGADEDAWAAMIESVIATIRVKHPNATEILLQPIVGGPGHADCYFAGTLVRASWQHAHIDNAIARVVGGQVQAGASPEVGSCDDYRDEVGHLTPDGAQAAGARIGAFYTTNETTTTLGATTSTTTSVGTTSTTTTLPPTCATSGVQCHIDDVRRLIGTLDCSAPCRCEQFEHRASRVEQRVHEAIATPSTRRCRHKLERAAALATRLDRKVARALDLGCVEPAIAADTLRTTLADLVAETMALADGGLCARP